MENRKMTDYTSALYLGLCHPSSSLPPWKQLTTGKPAWLYQSQEAVELGNRVAHLQGFEAGVLAASTLHLSIDLFRIFCDADVAVFIDAKAYPILQWGAEQAKLNNRKVIQFPHQDEKALRVLVRKHLRNGQKPVIVCDGWCAICGKASPLQAFQQIARKYRGWLVVDDTQALGILGADPSPAMPWGYGGGGTFSFLKVERDRVITVCSMAKAFGVPVAVLSASKAFIALWKEKSQTFLHCSQPSMPVILAGLRALRINQAVGNCLRKKLLLRIYSTRRKLTRSGFAPMKSSFPFQAFSMQKGHKSTGSFSSLIRNRTRFLIIESHTTTRKKLGISHSLYFH
jgi:8-amino-7-oxononanoate synthase